MIKGLAITPPVIGRISIGHLVEKNGKYLPEKDDSFTLTTQVQGKDGWLLHPLNQTLAETSPNNKIRAIPIKLLFNDSDLNLRAEFSAFDRQTGRPVCVGNGECAKRVSGEGIEDVACPTPERCQFGKEKGCKLYGRLNVQVEGQNDELGSFIFRTTGYNSVRPPLRCLLRGALLGRKPKTGWHLISTNYPPSTLKSCSNTARR